VIIFSLQDRNIVFFQRHIPKAEAELTILALNYYHCLCPTAAVMPPILVVTKVPDLALPLKLAPPHGKLRKHIKTAIE
jgi:hypothetical protein